MLPFFILFGGQLVEGQIVEMSRTLSIIRGPGRICLFRLSTVPQFFVRKESGTSAYRTGGHLGFLCTEGAGVEAYCIPRALSRFDTQSIWDGHP